MKKIYPVLNQTKTAVLYKWVKKECSNREAEEKLQKTGYYLLKDNGKFGKIIVCKRPCFVEEEMGGLPEGLEYVTPEEEKEIFKNIGEKYGN